MIPIPGMSQPNKNLQPYNAPYVGPTTADFDLKDADEALAYSSLRQLGNYESLMKSLNAAAQKGAGQMQTGFGQYAPNLQTNFQQFNPNINTNFAPQGGLDSYSQAILSQGQQDIGARLATQQNQIRRQLGPNNPGGNIVAAQQGMRASLNANPLLMQVQEAQRSRQAQEQQLSNQAIMAQQQERARLMGMSNEASLAGMSARANLQNMGNSALMQQLQALALPLSNAQNMMSNTQSLMKSV